MKITWNYDEKNLIGKKVKQLRIDLNLSQRALAEKLQIAGYDINDLTILRIEKQTRFVSDYEVFALAKFFNVSADYLLGVSESIMIYDTAR